MDGSQVHLCRQREIGVRALQERDLIVAGLPYYGAGRLIDLREGDHTGGETLPPAAKLRHRDPGNDEMTSESAGIRPAAGRSRGGGGSDEYLLEPRAQSGKQPPWGSWLSERAQADGREDERSARRRC